RGASLEDFRLGLGEAVQTPGGCLPLPRLAFGPSGRPTVVLPPVGDAVLDFSARRRWNEDRMAAIRKHGPFRSAPLGTPYLVYPASLERDGVLERFVDETRSFLQLFGHDSSDFELTPYEDTARARDIIDKVIAIQKAGHATFIFLGLPAHAETTEK